MYTKGIDGSENEPRNDIFPGSPSIRSEGQLYNYQNEYRQNGYGTEPEKMPEKSQSLSGKLRSVLGGFETDDLLLIAIGILILLDGDEDNDVLLIFILALLFL